MNIMQSMFNLDADQAALAYSKVESVYKQSLEALAKAPESIRLFGAMGQGQSGLTVETKEYDAAGRAKIIAAGAGDLPEVAAVKGVRHQNVHTIGSHFSFTFAELEASARFGLELDGRKHAANMRAHAAELDRLFFAGDEGYGIVGLKGYKLAEVASKDKWTAKDAAGIAADMRAAVREVAKNSNGILFAERLVLSAEAYDIASTKNSNGKTAVEMFKAAHPTVELVESFAMRGQAGLDLVAFNATAGVVGVWVPMFGFRHAEQVDGLVVKVPVETRTAGLVVNDAAGIVKVSNII